MGCFVNPVILANCWARPVTRLLAVLYGNIDGYYFAIIANGMLKPKRATYEILDQSLHEEPGGGCRNAPELQTDHC